MVSPRHHQGRWLCCNSLSTSLLCLDGQSTLLVGKLGTVVGKAEVRVKLNGSCSDCWMTSEMWNMSGMYCQNRCPGVCAVHTVYRPMPSVGAIHESFLTVQNSIDGTPPPRWSIDKTSIVCSWWWKSVNSFQAPWNSKEQEVLTLAWFKVEMIVKETVERNKEKPKRRDKNKEKKKDNKKNKEHKTKKESHVQKETISLLNNMRQIQVISTSRLRTSNDEQCLVFWLIHSQAMHPLVLIQYKGCIPQKLVPRCQIEGPTPPSRQATPFHASPHDDQQLPQHYIPQTVFWDIGTLS